MSIKCALGFHSWDGGECTRCGRKRNEGKEGTSGRCGICSESESSACDYPYTGEEAARFLHIGTVFHQGAAPEDAIQQLMEKEGWDHQSTRNCVKLTYRQLEESAGYAPYKKAEDAKKATKKAIRRHERKKNKKNRGNR